MLERVRARVLGAARARLSPADAEDLTQELLVLLTTKYAHVGAPEELVAIGVRIVAFKRAALWRKATLDAASEAPDPEAVARSRQRLSMFVEAASRLDGRCRQLLRRKLEGASFAEIAAELGRSVNTVYSWDYRCHQRLKTFLAERWAFVSGEAS